MDKYSGMKFSVSADEDGLSVAYLAIDPEGCDRPKSFKNIDIKSVLPQIKGPQVIIDLDKDDNIIGIEIIL